MSPVCPEPLGTSGRPGVHVSPLGHLGFLWALLPPCSGKSLDPYPWDCVGPRSGDLAQYLPVPSACCPSGTQ